MLSAVKSKYKRKCERKEGYTICKLEDSLLEKVMPLPRCGWLWCLSLCYCDVQIVRVFVGKSNVDKIALVAISGTCKRLQAIACSQDVWRHVTVVCPKKSINLHALSLLATKCKGTEGICRKVVGKSNGVTYALKESRPFPEVRPEIVTTQYVAN
jgi:hypothetical protein